MRCLVRNVSPVALLLLGLTGCAHVHAGAGATVCIVKSIPALDEAAAVCVKHWRFKPAKTEGNPVAVWVGVPVKFEAP
jgi:hypothetical protein